jgi:hypothetical protein
VGKGIGGINGLLGYGIDAFLDGGLMDERGVGKAVWIT